MKKRAVILSIVFVAIACLMQGEPLAGSGEGEQRSNPRVDSPSAAPSGPGEREKRKAPSDCTDVEWKDEMQKLRCESYLEQLGESFHQARYYSIQGDPCKCADSSERFLEIIKTGTQDCPKDYFANKGFSDRIVRNIDSLKELGTRRCLDASVSTKGKL